MTLFPLLTKELRTRLRSERTVWVMFIYILLLVVLGWFYVSSYGSNLYNLSQLGNNLYMLLALVQLALLLFITPAFTATAINGEKERQTFELLLCSRLSSLTLVLGKLMAGMTNSLLVIAASIPVFSIVLFFGGVNPLQLLGALLIDIITALLLGTFGLFCSILFKRPSISTSITYVVSLSWVLIPVALTAVLAGQLAGRNIKDFFVWNPGMALLDLAPALNIPTYTLGALHANIAPWVTYIIISLVVTIVLLLLSILLVKPFHMRRRRRRSRIIPASGATASA